jgi:nucleotide-binding universal stress UspA family protein
MTEAGSDHNLVAAGRVVVGVDGSARNLSAVEWAVRDALLRDRPLHLLGVAHVGNDAAYTTFAVAETGDLLTQIQKRAVELGANGEITSEVRFGSPAEELLKAQHTDDLLVLGRRGIGPLHRGLLGSTSSAMVERSPWPVVVVPDGWREDMAAVRSVVAACDGTDRDMVVLDLAFREASARGLRLVAVAAVDLLGLRGWTLSELERAAQETRMRLSRKVRHWEREHSEVTVSCWAPATGAVQAIVDASVDAGLVVLGRCAAVHHLLPGVSVTHQVLSRVHRPIAVAPAPLPDPTDHLIHDDDVPEF